MKVSFAITTHNEGDCIGDLLSQLRLYIEEHETDDEIVILDDESDDPDTLQVLETYSEYPEVSVCFRELNQNFGAQKNYLNSLCSGDYIFQIDADELLAQELLDNLHTILEQNSNIDLIFLPRINTVEGLTEDHMKQWGWSVDEQGRVLWPDYQGRIYRNDSDIVWIGRVHERIEGHSAYASLPAQEEYAILHHKSIERQETQNAFYDQIVHGYAYL